MRRISLLSPEDGATVRLLRDEHYAFLDGRYTPRGTEPLDSPREVKLRFRAGPDAAVRLRDDEGNVWIVPAFNDEVVLNGLMAGKKYHWCAMRFEEVSEERCFYTEGDVPRWIVLGSGVDNSRDAGGHKTRDGRRMAQGRLYRTSEWNAHDHYLTESAQSAIKYDYKIRTEIDLRGCFEEAWPAMEDVRWLHYPVLAYADMFKAGNQDALLSRGTLAAFTGVTEDNLDVTRGLFRAMADKSIYPAAIHCWGGTDRSGTVCAVLQALCNVPIREIERDYVASSFTRGTLRTPEYPGWPELKALLTAYPDNEEKSARELLKGIGLETRVIDRLRAVFLD